ncbi:hypothetical protein SARC_07753 [Sphaeroforma arctica JP610]|uniref:PD-(D/E)XK endonuclease-like domain-containing protein n=1 Tax=Sphaeroforma arctica JP610 TaxID=667725 RepID=A0A0L0FVA1_9EUKA|nr:hypothetical protein SARC_07753 [Sphaeroforma arctica JP610]KNC79868.1 hypothetical protein SARC_07753 [Sphaeroforma arctica JP610]|eukprot:XP_014153770.1 hypothetical protein SARC_07753 [Sphaeroforma arctica JP610]
MLSSCRYTSKTPWLVRSCWTRSHSSTSTFVDVSAAGQQRGNTGDTEDTNVSVLADRDIEIDRICDAFGFRIGAEQERPMSLTRGSVSSVYGDRFYFPVEGAAGLLSVTSVIDASKRKDTGSKLNKWKNRMKQVYGESSYQAARNMTLDNGTRVHKYAEDFLTGNRSYKLSSSELDDVRFAECAFSLRPVLARVEKVYAIESDVFSVEKGIAGRFDCIAKIDGKCVLIDWKTSAKKKAKRKLTVKDHHETPLQLSAYVTGTKDDAAYSDIHVEGALIVTCFSTGRMVEEMWLDQQAIGKYAQEFEKCVELAYSELESANIGTYVVNEVVKSKIVGDKKKRRVKKTKVTKIDMNSDIELASFSFAGFDLIEREWSELDCYLFMAKIPGR